MGTNLKRYGEFVMGTRIAVLVSYFLVVLGIGFIARTRWKSSPETYFLADRKLGTLILLDSRYSAPPVPVIATAMHFFPSWALERASWP
jgi:hypothetical protein